MRISTAGRYALRVMLDLALYSEEGPVLRQEIGRRQEISPEYIAQLFRRLARAGLAKSVMGPGGGYLLGLPAGRIRVGDILQAVEGPIALAPCVSAQGQVSCNRASFCAAHVMWVHFSRAMEDFLNSLTLADLCQVTRQIEVAGGIPCQQVVESFLTPVDRLDPPGEGCSWLGVAPAGEHPRLAPEYSI